MKGAAQAPSIKSRPVRSGVMGVPLGWSGINGVRRPAVKLSDNPEKATGDTKEIERYLRIFGDKGRVAHEVVV